MYQFVLKVLSTLIYRRQLETSYQLTCNHSTVKKPLLQRFKETISFSRHENPPQESYHAHKMN